MHRTALALLSLTGCPSPGDTDLAPCDLADWCITIADDGSIDAPALSIQAGESVAFVLADRWQSIADLDSEDPAACDDGSLESPYLSGAGLTGPMPRFAGGITVRGEPDGDFRFPQQVWESDAVSGVLLVIPWRDVEPSPGVYEFDVFTEALTEATKYGKLVSIGVQMGAKCPTWIYDLPGSEAVPGTPMVTKATGGERCFDQVHPSFWSPAYVERITALQTALADTLTAHAGAYRHVDKIKISGVNLLTSETRMPVDRENFCGFEDAVCSNGSNPPTPCVAGVCPEAGCGCAVDPADGVEKCGRLTDDLPQLWADAGYRPSKLSTYFEGLFDQQAQLFPEKDLNLMEIARAFPNVDESGVVQGFADPDHMRALIEQQIQSQPDRFVVLNAALNGSAPPQDICLESYDAGAQQIGFQMVNGLNTWVDMEPALANARDTPTPGGTLAVSFVEIYLASFAATVTSGDSDALAAYDQAFRERSELPNRTGEVHVLSGLPAGEYPYKVAGTGMSGGACHTGTLTVLP